MGCHSSKQASVDTQQQPPKAAEVAIVQEELIIPVPKVTCRITLEKDSDAEEFGTTVAFPDKTSLLIKAFTGKGTVVSHNAKNLSTPDAQVRLGDCIIEVNGVSGDKDEMMAEIKKSTTLALIVKRDGAAPSVDAATARDIDLALEQKVEPVSEQKVEPDREQEVEPDPVQKAEPDPEQKVESVPEQKVEPDPEQKVAPAPENDPHESNLPKVSQGALEVEIVDRVANKPVEDMQGMVANLGEASPDEKSLDVPTFEDSILPLVVKDKEEGAVPNRGCGGWDNLLCCSTK